jgi:hypothetical protein
MNVKKNPIDAARKPRIFDETDYELQHRYVETLRKKGDASFSLVAAEAFVEGMRDSGYKSTGTAIDEFVDNSIQAQAQHVDVLYEVGISEENKHEVSNIAIIDDGHGMEPDMIRAAVLWGGTHRANDRTGFGRYGFGLPSAAVSISKHYEVYSRTDGFEWHRVVIDLPEICMGKYTNSKGIVVAPPSEKTDLPDFVKQYLRNRKLTHGTAILLSNPDRLTTGYRRPSGFHKSTIQHLGLVYRHVLRNCALFINGERVQAVDPLFLDPSARFYDVGNSIFAEGREELQFEVKASNGKVGRVKLRLSCMPIGFQNGGVVVDGRNNNQRFSIMADNNSYFIICRAGRQIDLVTHAHFPKDAYNKVIINYDRNWAVEIDFDPVLDEEFGITVNKQQVVISERLWAILDDQGVGQMVKALWESIGKARKQKKAAEQAADVSAKESEQIMSESEQFVRKAASSPEKEMKAKERVFEEAEKKSKETGKPKEVFLAEIAQQSKEHPNRVMLENREGAPFFRTEQFGAQKRLFINTAHEFFSDLYSGPDATPRVRTALELLLFAIGSCELDATGDLEIFYQMERAEWSKRLKVVLALLDRRDPVEDAESADSALSESVR